MSPPQDLKTFVSLLESANELVRVKCDVDPYLEVAAIVDRVCKQGAGNKCLLFENVKGSSIPLVANLFGSMKRMALSLGVEDIDLLARQLEDGLSSFQGFSAEQALKQLVKKAADEIHDETHAKEVSDRNECRLSDLPALQSWPGDGGKYLTLAQVFSSMPGESKQNCGMYRMQLIDDARLLLRCHHGSGGSQHLEAWRKLDHPMPVAITLGGPPALTWAAGVSLPEDIDEADFVRWLTGLVVPFVDCQSSMLKVPAFAEIVIEGTVSHHEELPEGPFGNHTGLYSQKTPAPVVKIDSVTIRGNALYPCTVVGPPPMENVYLAKTAERLLLPLLKHDCPWVIDVHMPEETIYHKIAFVKVEQNCALGQSELYHCLKRSLLLKNSKMIIILDEDVCIEKLSNVYWNVINKGDPFQHLGASLLDARTPAGKHRTHHAESTLTQVLDRWSEYGV